MVQPSLQPPGGGNAVAAWMLQALEDSYDLSLLTWEPLDVEAVNRFYGTTLSSASIRSMTVSTGWYIALRQPLFPLALLRRGALQRVAGRISADYDVVISAENEMDLGRRGIQYLHYPAPVNEYSHPTEDIRWYHGSKAVVDVYNWACDRFAGVSRERIRQNLTLANSEWTARLAKARHGVAARILYPPVPTRFGDVPWHERSNGFLCLGRIAPDKELEKVIDIVAGVRRLHPDVTLRIIGTVGPRAYFRRLVAKIKSAPWVRLDLDLSREELLREIPKYRYGLHGKLEEHFGMAPAEMVAAGCIVFVHRSGGQVEIVGGDPHLVYGDVEDAVGSASAVIAEPGLQQALRSRLQERRHLFSVEQFVAGVRQAVAEVSGQSIRRE
jgi:glycosyltransferase involved in cell wall biosynthesis